MGEVRVLSLGGNVAVANVVESDTFFALLEGYLFRRSPIAFEG